MPLIAFAYAAFVVGLLAGFGGMAWIAVVMGTCAALRGLLAHRIQPVALALMLAGGALIGLTSTRPQRHRVAEKTDRHSVLGTMHHRASRSIETLFGNDAPMAKALLIADQHEIPPETRDRYARSGMVHMLSISGLHVAIVAGAMMLLLQAAHLSRNAASLIGVLLTILYVAVIGAPPPAVRSATMLAVIAASRATQRPRVITRCFGPLASAVR